MRLLTYVRTSSLWQAFTTELFTRPIRKVRKFFWHLEAGRIAAQISTVGWLGVPPLGGASSKPQSPSWQTTGSMDCPWTGTILSAGKPTATAPGLLQTGKASPNLSKNWSLLSRRKAIWSWLRLWQATKLSPKKLTTFRRSAKYAHCYNFFTFCIWFVTEQKPFVRQEDFLIEHSENTFIFLIALGYSERPCLRLPWLLVGYNGPSQPPQAHGLHPQVLRVSWAD